MNPDARRALLRHLVALDLMVIAAGIGYLGPDSPELLFGAFVVAVAVAAIAAGDEIGVAATAYGVVTIAVLFPTQADAASLMAFAATGAVISTIVRVIKVGRAAAAQKVPRRRPPDTRPTLALVLGLPLLVIVMYTDVSDILMRKAPVPSLLQPLILLMTFAVLKWRRELQPETAALQPVIFALAAYGLVVFSTSIWAPDAGLVDDSFAEIVKALFIAILAASLAPTRGALQRAVTALIAAAAVLSAVSVVQITTGRFLDAFGGLVSPQVGTMYEHIMMPRAAGPPNSDPNFYARILLIAIPLAVAYAVVERNLRRLAYVAAAAVITAGTLVTYSRGAMLALGVMALLLLIGLRVRPRHIALGAAGGIVALLVLPTNISRRLLTIETLLPGYAAEQVDYDSSVEKRKLLVAAGLAMFGDNPIAGVGAGHYGRLFPRYANEIGSPWIDYHPPGTKEHPHGLYFEIASETGLLGLLAFAAVVVASLASLRRSRRAFLARRDRKMAIMCIAVGVAIISYLVASIFLHETHLRYLALYFGFAIALARMARYEVYET